MTNEEAIKYHRESYQSFIDTMWDGDEENNPYDEAFQKEERKAERERRKEEMAKEKPKVIPKQPDPFYADEIYDEVDGT